jgi:hypothetical protein
MRRSWAFRLLNQLTPFSTGRVRVARTKWFIMRQQFRDTAVTSLWLVTAWPRNVSASNTAAVVLGNSLDRIAGLSLLTPPFTVQELEKCKLPVCVGPRGAVQLQGHWLHPGCGTRRFNMANTKAGYRTRSWASSSHLPSLPPTSVTHRLM